MNLVLRAILLFLFCLVTLNVSLSGQCDFTVEAGPDQTVCKNLTTPGDDRTSFQLNGSIGNETDNTRFSWSGGDLDDATILDPTGQMNQTTTFYLTGTDRDGMNLITDGDFESATDDEFFNGYRKAPIRDSLILPGYYDVIPGIPSNPEFCQTCDHTIGNSPPNCGGGNFLVLNGATTPNTPFWCQTIDVMPNTEYIFSYWVANVDAVPPDPAPAQSQIRTIIDQDRDRMPRFESVGSSLVSIEECGVWNLVEHRWNSDDVSGLVDLCMVELKMNLRFLLIQWFA